MYAYFEETINIRDDSEIKMSCDTLLGDTLIVEIESDGSRITLSHPELIAIGEFFAEMQNIKKGL